jgi:hypothetical protein
MAFVRRIVPLLPLAALSVLCAFALAAIPSCAFDWSVDARADASARDAGADVAHDATVFDATTADVTSDDAGEQDSSTPTDGGDCATLQANVATAKANAIACTQDGFHCLSNVKDECNCVVWVGLMGSAQSNTYVSAVQAYVTSGCAIDCSAGCGTLNASVCLLGTAGKYQCDEP